MIDRTRVLHPECPNIRFAVSERVEDRLLTGDPETMRNTWEVFSAARPVNQR